VIDVRWGMERRSESSWDFGCRKCFGGGCCCCCSPPLLFLRCCNDDPQPRNPARGWRSAPQDIFRSEISTLLWNMISTATTSIEANCIIYPGKYLSIRRNILVGGSFSPLCQRSCRARCSYTAPLTDLVQRSKSCGETHQEPRDIPVMGGSNCPPLFFGSPIGPADQRWD
jgi:hypothetical protein